ncbi:MAG TPA: YebC/PmpR family DNA-binding transcriptional regulator [Candidatus Paceibacterota bacterium]|nr:YebC/PmpR family DNA-binding transcriptional regulator [Candidatus Paceibacterota bacterium]
MAGHNKWAQIKRQKGANDAARGALFGKLARRITVEAKKAGGDLNSASLRAAIEKAKAANMPKENIERAVSKATAGGADMESVIYEAYGPGGAAVIIEALTDNKNRTLQDLKAIFAKHNINLAAPGSALWAFTKTEQGYQPNATVPLSEEDDAALMKIMELIDALDDVEEVYTNAQ